MPLHYHQATFDVMGKKPLLAKSAIKALEQRERVLGITLPASLKEFYSLKGACGILEKHSDSDVAVPIKDLGDPEELEHGVIRFQDDGQGMGAWYVRLDGSDDPPVELNVEGSEWLPPEGSDDWSWWDVARFDRVADHFSEFIYERVFTYGYRGDRKSAAGLKPYEYIVRFDDGGRAIAIHPLAPYSVNDIPHQFKPLDSRAMSLLRQLVHVRDIRLRSDDVEPSSWARLRGHPGIVRLEDEGSIDDDAVEHLVTMPALREMRLCGERLTDRGLDRLLRGHQFTELSICLDNRLTGAGLAALSTQVGLERLGVDIRESPLTAEALANVSGAASLKRLEIEAKEVIAEGLRHLAGLPRLEQLVLYLPGLTDDDLVHLAGLTSLTSLRVGLSKRISGHGLKHLASLGNLKTLDLGGLPIEDEALVHVAALSSLEKLNLAACRIAGPGLRHLSRLPFLRELDLRDNDLSDESMPHLAALQTLDYLDIAHAKITDAGLRQLAPIRNIAYLGLNGVNVSLEAIRDIRPDRPP